MSIYYVLFVVLIIPTFYELGGRVVSPAIKILLVFLLIGISGFRYQVGDDYLNYCNIFNDPLGYQRIEPGFMVLVNLVRSLGFSVQMLFLLCSVIIILPLSYAINKLFPDYFATAFSAYVLCYVFFEGMNTVRQAIAMTIMFVAICKFITNRRFWYFLFYVLFASCFHFSAIIIGVISWLIISYSAEDINELLYFVAIVLSFVAGFFILSFVDILADMSAVVGYANYLNNLEQRGVSSGLFHYVLNGYACYLLVFSYYKREVLSGFEKSIIKMVLVSVVLYNFFFNFYIGLRLYWFFYLFVVLLVPIIMKHCQKTLKVIPYTLFMFVFIVYTILSLGTEYYSNYQYSFNLLGE